MLKELRETLLDKADSGYKEFNDRLVPGTGKTIGVRVPDVRSAAKAIAREDFSRFLTEIEETSPESLYQEELMVQGMVIGYAKMPLEERFLHLDAYVPRINSWAVCDCGNSTLKFMTKNPEESFAYVCKYLESQKEYEVRFAVVTLMQYFITEPYIDKVLEIYCRVSHEGYYVKMAVAWAVSVCYVRFPEKTRMVLERRELEPWTHNKAIQKIRESRRVSQEEKEMLNRLKVK